MKALPRFLLVVGWLAATPLLAAEPGTKLEVKKGDVWVMTGDSITAQRLHSNYIEAFFRTRYPELGLQFRNSGIGGNRAESVLARFGYDVADFKPTIVSVELGMNDAGTDDPAKYIDGMTKLIEQIRAIPATPVLISSSPVNDGSKMDDWKGDRCRRIHLFTEALAKLAAEKKVTFVDQYHPLLAKWHENKQADGKEKVVLGGDPVHPGPVGQFTMAATILAGLNVDRDVSSATLKVPATVVEAKHCQISDVNFSNGALSFKRLDERSPWPIPANCRAALDLLPEIADLSRYTLTVTGLAAGDYVVRMNGMEVAQASSEKLAAGLNLGTLASGANAEQGAKVVALVTKLQGPLNNAWRAASKAKDTAKLAEAHAAIEACEAELAAACKPVANQWEVRAAAK